jgi:hypothetical protein
MIPAIRAQIWPLLVAIFASSTAYGHKREEVEELLGPRRSSERSAVNARERAAESGDYANGVAGLGRDIVPILLAIINDYEADSAAFWLRHDGAVETKRRSLVRHEALIALGLVPDARSVPVLERVACGPGEPSIERGTAIETLSYRGFGAFTQALVHIEECVSDEDLRPLIFALARTPDPKGREYLGPIAQRHPHLAGTIETARREAQWPTPRGWDRERGVPSGCSSSAAGGVPSIPIEALVLAVLAFPAIGRRVVLRAERPRQGRR